MKKINNCICTLLAAVIMTAAFFTPALAVVSQHDSKYLTGKQQHDIQKATEAWWDAYHAGNQSGMDDAHKAAEDVRASKDYSGGPDGSEYIPLPSKPKNPGGSSGGGGHYTPPAPVTYAITATAGTGGSISPSGSTSVTQGKSQAYTITAKAGYKIADVKVDGSTVGAVSTYTFSGVSAAHTINATFASAATMNAGSVTLGDGGSGTLKTGNKTKSGYGITVNLPVTSSYVSGTTVTANYNFTSAKSVSLEYVGDTWQFPVNNTSSTSARKVYIPVETKDGSYTITFTVKSLDPQATALTGTNVYLTSTKSVTLTIKGSMFEDDFTGDS